MTKYHHVAHEHAPRHHHRSAKLEGGGSFDDFWNGLKSRTKKSVNRMSDYLERLYYGNHGESYVPESQSNYTSSQAVAPAVSSQPYVQDVPSTGSGSDLDDAFPSASPSYKDDASGGKRRRKTLRLYKKRTASRRKRSVKKSKAKVSKKRSRKSTKSRRH